MVKIYELPPDIFNHLDRFGSPSHVYVLGAGLLGAPHYDSIPEDAFTIATNCMMDYGRAWNVVMAFDYNSRNQAWWNAKLAEGTTFLLGEGLAKMDPRAHYYFRHFAHAKTYKSTLARNKPITSLPNGATISGAALMLAWLLGAEHITLVGCDFTGKFHYDGSNAFKYDELWPQKPHMENLIIGLQAKGVVIDSLSETSLRVRKV